jgi:DNA-binding HxlR family transcriptional regulator
MILAPEMNLPALNGIEPGFGRATCEDGTNLCGGNKFYTEVAMKESVSGCPVEDAMRLLGGRWRIVLVYHLLDGKRRFSDLRRAMPGISQRMLTLDLRALEKAGLVQRTIYPEIPPRVEYDLTEEGKRLRALVDLLGEVGARLANVPQCAPVRKSAA